MNDEEEENNNKNINYNLIINKPSQRRTSILKSPKRNSLEFSDTKIIEELNLIIKNKFVGQSNNNNNEIILNVNVKPFCQVSIEY